jgi:hypothetical protein
VVTVALGDLVGAGAVGGGELAGGGAVLDGVVSGGRVGAGPTLVAVTAGIVEVVGDAGRGPGARVVEPPFVVCCTIVRSPRSSDAVNAPSTAAQAMPAPSRCI